MNKYIEEYIEKTKKEQAEEKIVNKEALLRDIANKLKIGEKEFRKDFPDEPEFDFPYLDYSLNQYYRYTLRDVSDEDFAELLKYLPEDEKPEPISTKRMSGWYTFIIIIMVIAIVGSIAVAVKAESGFVALGSIIGVLVFFAQLILLCKIEYNTRQ